MARILKAEAQKITGWEKLLEKGKVRQANPPGCDKCSHKGYKGRVGVFEMIVVNDEMQSLIHQNPDEIAVRNLALKSGTVSLMADAILKVLKGVTDLAEVEKMVGPVL